MDAEAAVLLAAAIASLVLFLRSLNALYLARASRSWPVSYGKVEDIRVGPVDARTLTGGQRQGFGFEIKIRYVYEAAGMMRTGTRVQFGPVRAPAFFFATEEAARPTLKEFEVGSTVRVHVDPSDPSRSVLVPGAAGLLYVSTAIGLFVWPLFFYGLVSKLLAGR